MNDEWLERYSRQILLAEIDFSGQEAIAAASVAVVGCGGLGSMIGLYLAGAGVGAITLIDDDVVEVSNLHRQLAFRESDLDDSKSEALARQLRALNQNVVITAENYRFGSDSVHDAPYSKASISCSTQPIISMRVIILRRQPAS